MLTVMILKGVGDSIFFQSNEFTACKIKDEKEVAIFLWCQPTDLVANGIKYKCFSVFTQFSVTVTLFYFT